MQPQQQNPVQTTQPQQHGVQQQYPPQIPLPPGVAQQQPVQQIPLPPAPNQQPAAAQQASQIQQPQQFQPPVQQTGSNKKSHGLKAPPSNPNSTQNILNIAEIRDGVVIMNDGSYRAVIFVKSINFDLMSAQEREAVEFSYQGFINSLYFPIQIFIQSRKVDMDSYLENLKKHKAEQENMLLALLMDDYVYFISDLVQQTNIMDKKFYIVIPYYPGVDLQHATAKGKSVFGNVKDIFKINGDAQKKIVINEADLNTAKTELRNRVQAALGALQQTSIQGIALDTQELIELYYDVYNPDTATNQHIVNRDDINVPVVRKGDGQSAAPNTGGIF